MLKASDFSVGEKVMFGRGRGEQTLGEVVKVNRCKLKVKQLESRGTKRVHPVGTIWTVPPSLCSKTGDGAPVGSPLSTPPAKPKRTEAEILADAQNITFLLEPEMLYCDGERSPSAARRVAANLRRQFRDLERELGRKITEYGHIDGLMPATFGVRQSAKDSGWKIGDKVSFAGRRGETVTGYVKRVNTKTVSVQPLGGGSRYWRVSPGMLRAA